MSTHNICFDKNYMKIVKTFQLKIVIFKASKNRCILHGRVFIMSRLHTMWGVKKWLN